MIDCTKIFATFCEVRTYVPRIYSCNAFTLFSQPVGEPYVLDSRYAAL